MAGLLNSQAQQAQPNQAPQQGGSRKATPEEQAQYKTMVMQVVKFMSQPKNVEMLKQMVDQMGPERALAMMISQSLQLVGQAAKQSGVNVAVTTGTSALKEIVTVFASMLAAAGKIQDVNQTVQAVIEMIMSGGQQAPQQPQVQPAQQPQAAPAPMGA